MKTLSIALILPVLGLASLSACTVENKSKPDLNAETQAILDVENAMRIAQADKDADKLAALYAEDATLYVPREQRPRVGRQAIADGARKDMADTAYQLTFTTGKTGVFASGDAGYTKGSFTVRYTDPQTKAAAGYSGYYLTLFTKDDDGKWKVIEDMATPAS